jgi:hypothetical protein
MIGTNKTTSADILHITVLKREIDRQHALGLIEEGINILDWLKERIENLENGRG